MLKEPVASCSASPCTLLHPPHDAYASAQVFLVAGIIMAAAFVLRNALVSYWTLRTELMKAKFKMRAWHHRAHLHPYESLIRLISPSLAPHWL